MVPVRVVGVVAVGAALVGVLGWQAFPASAGGDRVGRGSARSQTTAPKVAQPTPSMVVAVAESEVAARRVVPVTASGQATITIPAAGVSGLSVVRYVGSPDDAHGTTFEERGLAASPTGSGGGVDPGQVGNSIVTAHRTSAGGPFLRVPELRSGDRVEVTWGGRTFVYAVVGRFLVTFHDPASYARQVAAVPGFPGQRATHAMLTLSTCATPEDNAAGLHERDALGNPPHRIDIVAQLVAVR